jgi:hypothetical protein
MEWFDRVVLGAIRSMMQAARDNYGVDPIAFIVIYLSSVPFFYYSIFRMVRALARKKQAEIRVWSMIFLTATAAPFIYVLLFGRNLPWWVYVVIALLIGQGVFSLVKRLRKKPESPASGAGITGGGDPPSPPQPPGET